jgi:hypothetical protein
MNRSSASALGLILILGFLFLAPTSTAWSQTQSGQVAPQVLIKPGEVDFTFGERITFQAAIETNEAVDEALLFLQTEGQTNTEVNPVSLAQPGKLVSEYDLSQRPLRVFANVQYWYRLTFASGAVYTSDRFQFFYTDNRFNWQALDSPPFRLHWYTGDVTFAQTVMNVAQEGMQYARSLLSVFPPQVIELYVYDSPRKLQSALVLTGQDWVAGYTDPRQAMILVSLPPGLEQRLEMERQIPHELMHVMLYHTIGAGYDRLPVWLNEGLASMAELYPNPDYQILLTSAHKKKSLLAIGSLCQAFPRDASGALLAYAEAASFTRYLYGRFGAPGIERLIVTYAKGLDCSSGAEQALEVPLARLESQWRQEVLGENQLGAALERLLPWLVMLPLVLIAPGILMLTGGGQSTPRRAVQAKFETGG